MSISLIPLSGKIVDIRPGCVVGIHGQFTYTVDVVYRPRYSSYVQSRERYTTASEAKQRMREQVSALRRKHIP